MQMNGQEDIPATEKLVHEVASGLPNYAVGFVKRFEDHTPPDAQLGGSGTLVIVDGTHAILTAAHVLDHLPRKGEIGLLLCNQFRPRWHRFMLPMEITKEVFKEKGPVEGEGPDLALLALSSAWVEVGELRAHMSFYNLSRRQQEVLSRPRPTHVGMWCLCGIVDEWTAEAKAWRGRNWERTFGGIVGEAKVLREYTRGEYDYIEFGERGGPEHKGPRSFKGCSGGGLWQIVIGKSEAGNVVVRDTILSGVAFYECEDGLPIRCHGRRSIYDTAVGKMRARPF